MTKSCHVDQSYNLIEIMIPDLPMYDTAEVENQSQYMNLESSGLNGAVSNTVGPIL